MAFDVLGHGPSNSTIHSKKGPTSLPGLCFSTCFLGPTWVSGLWLATFWDMARPIPPFIQKRARRGSLALGFRRFKAWPDQFQNRRGYKVGHPLRFTSSLTAHPIPPWIQKRARRGSLAFGFRRLGAWPVQFNHSFKKGPDVPSGPLLFDVFFGPDVGQWPLAGDVLGHGPSNSTIHSKKGPTWITGPGLSTF